MAASTEYDRIRLSDAGTEHLDAIAGIYAYAVRTSHATFDLEEPPRSVWDERLAEPGPGLRLLVASTTDGEVAGFARSSRYRPKVAEPNPASTRLHQSLGFSRVGTMAEVGHKFGAYWDVTWWQKRLGEDPDLSSR